jgi:glycogen(starch) synthase
VLAARIHAGGLARTVRLLGRLSEEELALAYRAADVTIVPSVALEGFGLVAAESLSAGTPVLVTPVGGLPEVVSPLSDRLVLQACTREAVAEGLVSALRGTLPLPDDAACRRFARERYDWSVIAAAVGKVYRDMAGGGT